MNFRALSDRVFVKADDPEAMTRGGLHLPESARKKTTTGIVRYIGPGMLMKNGERWPMVDAAVGDRVMFLNQPWPRVMFEGEELVSMREDGLLAVMVDDDAAAAQ